MYTPKHLAHTETNPVDSGLSLSYEARNYAAPRLLRAELPAARPMPLAPVPAYRDAWAGNPDTDKFWSK